MSDASLKGKIVSGMFWKTADIVVTRVISFVVSIVLARILMPSDYGVIAMVNVFITVADVFVTSGLNTALVQKKEITPLDLSTIFFCSLTVALALYATLFFAAPAIASFYSEPQLTLVLRVLALELPFQSLNSIQSAYAQREMIFRVFFWSSLFGTLAGGAVGIAMAYAGFGVWALVANTLGNILLDTLVMLFTIHWRPSAEFSLDAARPLVCYGWKILVTDLVGTIFNQINSFIIGRKYTAADLAYYDRGTNIPTLINNTIQGSIIGVLFPAMSQVQDDRDQFLRLVRRSIRLLSYLMFPLLTGMFVCAPQVIVVLLTEKWLMAVPYFRVACIGGMFGVPEIVAGRQVLRASGRSDLTLRTELIVKPISLAVIIASMNISVLAMALALVISGIVQLVVELCFANPISGYRMREELVDILPALALSTVMGVCVYAVTLIGLDALPCLLLQVLAGVAAYVVLSKLTRNESFDEIEKMIKNRRGARGC